MLKKIICVILAALAPVSALCGCSGDLRTRSEAISVPTVTGEFKTTFLDVGKADAIILETKKCVALIDTGEKNDGDEVLEYLDERGIDKVDYMFITHFDKDHVGGAPEILKGVKVGKVITPDYEGNNDEYSDFVAALDKAGISEKRLTEYMTVTMDDTVLEIYPPLKKIYKEEDNDFSLVINATHGKNTFMFAGDCETVRLSELESQMDMEHIFLKVPHHGVYCYGMDEFINSVSPKYAVITDSEKNPADEEVYELLENVGSEIYETIFGNITAVSDGKKITVMQ